jgi:DUF1680 family protein
MKSTFVFSVFAVSMLLAGCVRKNNVGDYPITPVPFTAVHLTDSFWAPRIAMNAKVTIPIAFGYCESTGRVRNFDIAAGVDTGKFQTIYPFDDSDVFKIIEGAAFSLQTMPDPKLDGYLDTLIAKIGAAQEDDGYLYTNRTIAERNGGVGLHEWAHKNRWELDSILSHELYNLGHLYEAAVAHYQATGKRSLLDIALKSADLVYRDFYEKGCRVYPGHQVIEMGLVKLYRSTGERKYLDLAKLFLDMRGPKGQEYNQAHIRPVDQTTAVGHSVRATYMYSGMADIAALESDKDYLAAITSVWEDLVYRKMYVTGGIGASGGNEGFAEPYHLPNATAYCETCASIGDIFFNHRLFLLHGESKYYDVLEKTLYNAMLSGVSVSADRFFYPNPLESHGQHERSAWFGCACCPSNICRFIPALPGYIYAVTKNDLYINLFASNSAEMKVGSNTVSVYQKTSYPWDGIIEIGIDPETESKFSLKLRIPGWAGSEAIPGSLYSFPDDKVMTVALKVNGIDAGIEKENGYAVVTRKWKKGDVVTLSLPMPVREVVADERIKDDRGKVAIQKGPVIYCAEWPDNDGKVLNLVLGSERSYSEAFDFSIPGGALGITTAGRSLSRKLDGTVEGKEGVSIKLIPYALWNNRGRGEMAIWLPVTDSVARPLPAPTVARLSKVSASKETRAISAVNDQVVPKSSGDESNPFYHWWPEKDKWVWMQYDFSEPATISFSSVYWFDDEPRGGCRVPETWELLYRKGGNWLPVKTENKYTVTLNGWDTVRFAPVKTDAVRISVKLKKEFASGIHEWVVK